MSEGFSEGALLRIFVGQADKVDGKPLYDAICAAAGKAGLMGGTVLRGIESFGQKGSTHTARLLRLSEDLPVVVEIVDTAEKIERFIPVIDGFFEKAGVGGLVTQEKVRMKQYESSK